MKSYKARKRASAKSITHKTEGHMFTPESHPNSKRIKKQGSAVTAAELVEKHTHTGQHETHDHHHHQGGADGASTKPHQVHEPWQAFLPRVALFSSTSSPKGGGE